MKGRIPADVERLMWLVAESNDPQAIADFEQRFPDFRYELAQRRRMVSDLKGAKTGGIASVPIPAFKLRSQTRTAPPKQVWIATGFALAALAVASYSVTVWLNSAPSKLPAPPVVQTDTPKAPNYVQYSPSQEQQIPPKVETPPQSPAPTPEPEPSTADRPKTVKMSNTSLVAALKMIGSEAGYSVEIAPGFQDQKVTLDYENATTSEILKDLGIQYTFTAFDQGDGTIIIVPAITDGPATTGSPNGPTRQIGG